MNDDIQHFDRRAVTYDDSWVQQYVTQVHQAMLDSISDCLRKASPERILDIGCGTGRLLQVAATRWPEAELIGVDPAPQMLEIAKRRLPEAAFKGGSAEELPVSDETADLVLSSISFHHWADQKKGLSETTRVLRPDGLLCLADIVLPRWVARASRSRARDTSTIQRLLESCGTQVTMHKRCFAKTIAIMVARKNPVATVG